MTSQPIGVRISGGPLPPGAEDPLINKVFIPLAQGVMDGTVSPATLKQHGDWEMVVRFENGRVTWCTANQLQTSGSQRTAQHTQSQDRAAKADYSP